MHNAKAICVFGLFVTTFFISCNNEPNTDNNNESDSIVTSRDVDTTSMPKYDASLDPLHMGGEAIRKLHDTLNARIYEFSVKPGESWAIHNHPDHTVYVLQGGRMALYLQPAGGAATMDTLEFPAGTAFVSGPIADSGKNVGKTTIKMVVTDIYRPRGR